MSALTRARCRIIAASLAMSAASLALSGQAHPGGTGHGGSWFGGGSSGDVQEDGTLSASTGGIVWDYSSNGKGSNVGSLNPVSDWSPPPCWYAPKYTPKQLKKERQAVWQSSSTGSKWEHKERSRYVEGEPYTDFNMKKSGEGYWWDSYVDKDYPPGSASCDKLPFWVGKGEPPPADVPNTVTPELLAQLAYAEIRVPDTDIELSPPNEQKVNLPTWVWLDDSEFQPVSVTASVPVLDISATTTATPVSLHIEPGTEDANLHPASGTCPINEDGSIGTPYTDGTFGTTQNITVKEIQSIVR